VDLFTVNVPHCLEAEAALFVLLLWMAVLLGNNGEEHGVGRSTLACAIILSASSFFLLLLAPFVGLACIGRRSRLFLPFGLLVVVLGGIAWQMRNPETPIEALQYLPCMLSLLAGIMIAYVELTAVSFVGLASRPVVAVGIIVFALLRFPVATEGAQLLEYESIARATNTISHQFARQRWMIAAPVEQFAEVYSVGGFQDLAALVTLASSSDIAQVVLSNDSVDDLFIFVEKTPFATFQREPDAVSFLTLTDSTYRNYRSPAGRASLEVRAMELCESYKKKHKNMTVFFEDDNVRVYRLSRARDPGTPS
jgi:hypothetical protein